MSRQGSKNQVVDQSETKLNWDQILSWRLKQHHLDKREAPEAMFDVINDICGLQAQVLSYTELMLLARVNDIAPGLVDQALWEDRSLVKSWTIRGTLHLFPSNDYPLWQAALSTYRHYLKGSWLRHFGFTREELETVLAAVAEALDGRMLTREALAEEVATVTGAEELGEKLLDSWGATLKPASFRGHLCFAPNDGRNVRFTRPSWWLPNWQDIDPQEAVNEVTRRYLSAYGPVVRENHSRWIGVSPAQAQKRIERLGEAVSLVTVNEVNHYVLTEHVEEIKASTPAKTVNLLPGFDPYVLGAARDENNILADDFKDRVYRKQGWISPVLLVNGRMVGVWNHDEKANDVEVVIEPFTKQPKWVVDKVEKEANRLAKFLDKTLKLTWQG